MRANSHDQTARVILRTLLISCCCTGRSALHYAFLKADKGALDAIEGEPWIEDGKWLPHAHKLLEGKIDPIEVCLLRLTWLFFDPSDFLSDWLTAS